MTYVTIEEIKLDLLAFLKRVRAGETLVLTDANQAVAEIKPVHIQSTERRPFGLCAGEFRVPEDFNDPLPEDLLAAFDGR